MNKRVRVTPDEWRGAPNLDRDLEAQKRVNDRVQHAARLAGSMHDRQAALNRAFADRLAYEGAVIHRPRSWTIHRRVEVTNR